MAEGLNFNAVNQIEKDSVIYTKDEPLTSVGLIIKGRVLVEADGIRTIFSSGNFLGACDIEKGSHSFTYTAYDNTVLCVFPIQTQNDLEKILSQKKEYYGLLNTSLNYFILEMDRTYKELEEKCAQARIFVSEKYEYYQKFCRESGIKFLQLSAIDTLLKETAEVPMLEEVVDYYTACSAMPVESQKNYYMGSKFVSMWHFHEQSKCTKSLLKALFVRTKELLRYFRVLVLDEQNLFDSISRMALDAGHVGKDNSQALSVVDELIAYMNDTEVFLVNKVGQNVNLNRNRIEKTYYAILTGEDELPERDAVEEEQEEDLSILNDSMEQILSYATIDKEVKEEFITAVEEFRKLEDKFSKSDTAKRVRKSVTKSFYDIYETILLKSFEDDNIPTAVSMFLTYGYISEKLLDKETLVKIVNLKRQNRYKDGSEVYLLSEWLRAVYEGRKMPSRNEFDQGYEEFLKHEKAIGNVTETEMKRRLTDPREKLHFEIDNMFRYADRILHGSITMFVPVLYSEEFFTTPESAYLTSDSVNGAMTGVQSIDFSIFYRERVVFYEEVGITKETVMKKFTPDVILFPIYGKNSIMWQETTGKRKDTKGRFFFPILLESKLETEMVKVMGEFRWEICRSEQGMHWNNLHYPSLTSEYTDYLQFYRKNQHLSTEAKTKVKSQLTQSNNKHRSVFCKDYADWIGRESIGAMKVNKVVRGILSTYCPFRKEIRDKVMEQPVNAEAGKRFNIARAKALRQIEISCKRFEKEAKDIPEELLDTKEYLQNT